jgi:FixJ family two-component response regulator
MITSASAQEYESRSKAAGAVAFFRKPINNEELLNTIRLAIGDPASAGPAPAA